MENVLKIIYDKSINNKILDFKDIEKILELLVINKNLKNYILNIKVQPIRSNNLASYSNYTKDITLYSGAVERMIKDIEKNILIANDFEITLYKNLLILQALLHEVEHANQQKIAYNDNSLESFIIRLSLMMNNAYDDLLYEYCPEERFAEIKSFEDINILMNYLEKKLIHLPTILDAEKLQRLLRGYHYKNNNVDYPLMIFFSLANRMDLYNSIDISNQAIEKLDERMKFGFPISTNEYGESMNKLVLSLNKNFKNKINVK